MLVPAPERKTTNESGTSYKVAPAGAGDELVIYDALGIARLRLRCNAEVVHPQINIKQLPQGIYTVKFPNNPKANTLSFTIVR